MATDEHKAAFQNETYIQDLATIFGSNLGEISEQSLEEFKQKYPSESAQIDFKCDEASFLDVIQMTQREFEDAQERKRQEEGVTLEQLRRQYPETHHPLKTQRTFSFKLKDEEREKLVRNGVVVSSKTFDGFGGAFLTIYNNDLPLYISADSVLHAWHDSYDTILQEVEMVLYRLLIDVLKTMIGVLKSEEMANMDSRMIADARFFLSVPLNILDKNLSAGYKSARVDEALEYIELKRTAKMKLFGDVPREIDFSQFIPRGHYTKTQALTDYFLAMMWLGRTEFAVSSKPRDRSDILCALAIRHAFTVGEDVESNCNKMSKLITNFVGPTDSLTLQEFDSFLSTCEIDCFNFEYDRDIERLMQLVNEMDLGRQNINSQIRNADDEIPRAVTFMGQRFTIDSFVMEKVVFPNIPGSILRKIPSAVDVAFSVFGNNTAGQIACERMEGSSDSETHVRFRDGLSFQNNLEALRKTIEAAPNEFWESSVYGMWLKVLSTLSEPSPHPSASLHTTAWNKRKMMSQLSSWTQLRHDNILYVKQSYSMRCGCLYPDALVEPQPRFWETLEQLYAKCQAVIDEVGYPDERLQHRHSEFMARSATIIHELHDICVWQCEKNELTDDQNSFVHAVTEEQRIGGSGMRRGEWRGWYPKLFYRSPQQCKKSPSLVADVHTNPADPAIGDPGCIVHEGVGHVRLCYTIVENCKDVPTVYVGPVMGYYEHLAPIDKRLNDNEWKEMLQQRGVKLPEWLCDIAEELEPKSAGKPSRGRWR